MLYSENRLRCVRDWSNETLDVDGKINRFESDNDLLIPFYLLYLLLAEVSLMRDKAIKINSSYH